MKTIREWLSELPEGDLAIKNTTEERLSIDAKSRAHALLISFGWKNSPEGYKFWDSVFNRESFRNNSDAPSFSSPSPHRLFEQIAEYVDKHDLKTYKILVTDGTAEIIED